jgi:iron complex outermembrane receptor protein
MTAPAVGAPTNTPPALPSDSAHTNLLIEVTARKMRETAQEVPGALTVQSGDTLQRRGAQDLREASRTVPNLTLGEFTPRRLTFPYVRGIGAGQNDPAVTTCVDGVPQLSYVSANQELLDVERIEYLRGPQGALYGRNALGGAINVIPRPPSATPGGSVTLGAGNYGGYEGRFTATGPLGHDGLLGSLSGGYATREGYTRNDTTGHDLDSRESTAGRIQLLLPDQGRWSFRLALSGERDRDGDYTLYDLDQLRRRPHHVQHDYEGYNDRDLAQPVLTAQRRGEDAEFTSITAYQGWQVRESTDLDLTPGDLQRKQTREAFRAWSEELRLASPADRPVALSDRLALRWLTGLFAFDSRQAQHALTDYRIDGVPSYWPYPFQQANEADWHNRGLSLFGEATATLDERWELGAGLRHDYEHRTADFRTRYPPFPPAAATTAGRDFNQLTPHATLGYHFTPDTLAYLRVAQGFRAGGFNAITNATYDPETSWSCEAGLKSAWLHDRLTANLAAFHTRWDDIQVNTHLPGGSLSDYYVENGGQATSRGLELELQGKPWQQLDLFGSAGLLDTAYAHNSRSADQDVGGHELPFAPHFTWLTGSEFRQPLTGPLHAFLRLEVRGTSRSYFDASNEESQGSYALVNARLGVRAAAWQVEAWVKNLCDRAYVPLAIPYGPSYAGESGAPRTFGVSLTRYF